jgi:glycosyltransferase involved in cell wall biosynthesis
MAADPGQIGRFMMNYPIRKILYFIQLPPPVHGVSTINQIVFNSDVINRGVQKKLIRIRFSKDLSELRRFQLKKIWIFLITWFRLFKALLFFRPHIVYFSLMPVGVGFVRDVFYAFLIKLLAPEVIFHIHNRGIPRYSRNAFARSIYRWTFSNASVIHVSEGLVQSELAHLRIKNSAVFAVPNTIKDPIKGIAPTAHESINILFFSNMIPSKGLMVLLESFNALVSKHHHLRLLACGSSFDEKEDARVRSYIDRHHLQAVVRIMGACHGEDKQKMFSESDIFVFPSYFDEECFPLVILEAMSARLPIVATRIGAIPEMITDGKEGMLVEPGDPHQLAARIEKLAMDPKLRKKLGNRAHAKFKHEFDITIFEKKMRSILVPE